MIDTWTQKIENGKFALSPSWYVKAKADGVSTDVLFKMVKDFCKETLDDEPDDMLVELMIETYES
jgi:hypothetical protein